MKRSWLYLPTALLSLAGFLYSIFGVIMVVWLGTVYHFSLEDVRDELLLWGSGAAVSLLSTLWCLRSFFRARRAGGRSLRSDPGR